MNRNRLAENGDLFASFWLGRAAEYLKAGDLFAHLLELKNDRQLVTDYEEKVLYVAEWETKKFSSIWEFRSFRILLYCLVRDMGPRNVVETGVMHGMTSGFILHALDRNGMGRLNSFDLPSINPSQPSNLDGYLGGLPEGKECGWIVPDRLREYWQLHLGRSMDLLPDSGLREVDIFIHDSEHTYDTMWKELTFAWCILNSGGVLVCDNIEANPSFFDFCRRVNRVPLVLPASNIDTIYAPRFAVIRKD